jgi:hypothetical protein
MKRNTDPWTNKIIALSSLVYALALTAGPAFCSEEGVKLVLGQSPADGGIVTPGTGVHHFVTDATIAITANPQEGYRFSHWLGDVTDPASNTTKIHLNSSKAVMAVYEPIAGGSGEDSYMEKGYAAGGGSIGSGNLIPTRADFFLNGFSAPGGSARSKGIRPISKQATVPAPVPEPATFILLGMGSIIFARSAKRRKTH